MIFLYQNKYFYILIIHEYFLYNIYIVQKKLKLDIYCNNLFKFNNKNKPTKSAFDYRQCQSLSSPHSQNICADN
jgi:hypothetical protein